MSAPLAQLRAWPAGLTGRRAALAVAVVGLGLGCGAVTAFGQPWLGYVLLAAGGVAAVVVRWPAAGVLIAVGVIYLLPFGVVPVPLGGVRLSFLDITLTAVLALWLLRALARPSAGLVVTPAAPGVLALLAVMVTALLLGHQSVSAETFRFFLKAVNSVLLFFTVVNLFRTPDQVVQLARVLMLAAGGCAAIAIGLYALPPQVAQEALLALARLGYPRGDNLLRYIADTDTLRAIGTAVDPNVLGGMLAVALPLLLAQAFEARPVLPRKLLLALALAVGVALALTYSRGAWFGAAAGVGYLAGVRYRGLWFVGAVLLLLAVVSPPGQHLLDRLLSGVTFADRAAQMRLGEYKDALRLIGEYPWFGVGFGAAPSLDLYVGSSSIYLLIASQMGLVGLAAFLAAMGLVLRSGWAPARPAADPRLRGLLLGLTAGLLAALAAGVFDHYFMNLQFPHAIALLWLLAGALTATGLAVTPAGSPRAPSPAPPR